MYKDITSIEEYQLAIRGKRVLFVYGTLKQGFHNHSFVENRYVCKATTMNNCLLFERMGLPYFRLEYGEMGHKVEGEIYALEDMSAVDRLEGAPHHYKLDVVPVVTSFGFNTSTFVYCDEMHKHLEVTQEDCIKTYQR